MDSFPLLRILYKRSFGHPLQSVRRQGKRRKEEEVGEKEQDWKGFQSHRLKKTITLKNFAWRRPDNKVIVDKSGGEVSLLEQDTIENVS